MLKVLAALVLGIIVIADLLISPIFKIKEVSFNPQQNCINQDQIKNYQVLNQNLIFLNTNKLSQKLKADFTCAKDVKITKTPPNTLKIEVDAKNPVAKIESKDLQVTEDGQVTTQSTNSQLPTIFLSNQLQAENGKTITDAKTLFALKITALLLKSDFTPANIRFLQNDQIAVYSTSGIAAIFTSAKSADFQVDSLQQLLAKAKIDPLKIAKIDLRFDQALIVNK